ncbi:MAG: dethiobiotin synthase [Bacteroidales bacterium]|jgi:dethiobiotin synthetase|nr:dethiobiotin synthase [Bacteroidales bacterium]
MSQAFFISGIDTDCGKTFITGHLARNLYNNGSSVITQKLVQTGCKNIAEDIAEHRRIMEIPLQAVDTNGVSCPYNFAFPASPHFSALLENTAIDTTVITQSTKTLLEHYNTVLIETAGGLAVPLSKTELSCDYIARRGHSLILVTSSKLGSINHSLLSFLLCKQLRIPMYAVIYNILPDADEAISENTEEFLRNYVRREFPKTRFVTSKEILMGSTLDL